MITSTLTRFLTLFALLLVMAAFSVRPTQAQDAPAAPVPSEWDSHAAAGEHGDVADPDSPPANPPVEGRHHRHAPHHSTHGGDVINIFGDSTLPRGETAGSVVAIRGSASSEGLADEVVAVFGNTRVSGPVTDSAVAVFGNAYIDAKVDGDVVAVLGSIELGPHAEVGGDVVAVLGKVTRDPAAIVHGDVERVMSHFLGGPQWIQSWLDECLFKGRPLAFSDNVRWAWVVALTLLAFYALIAALFPAPLRQCVQTLDTHPGRTILAALLAVLLIPVAIVLLCVTVIGIAAVPFVILGLFFLGLFGKAVILGWIGYRLLASGRGNRVPLTHPAAAVLLGGVLVLALYCVPFLGFLVYKVLGILGVGAVAYTLLLAMRERQTARTEPPAPAGAPPPIEPAREAESFAAAAAMAPAGDGGAAAAANAAAAASDLPPLSANLPRAGFGVRMLALLLDVILVGVVMSLLNPHGGMHLVILAAYGAVMWKLRGATVGGIVFDLHVVRLDGRAVDWETSIVRALGCFLSLFVVGLGFFWIAFDHNSQAWHDKIAGTVVVRAPKPLL